MNIYIFIFFLENFDIIFAIQHYYTLIFFKFSVISTEFRQKTKKMHVFIVL